MESTNTLTVRAAQQAILDGIAARKRFHVILNLRTEQALNRQLVAWEKQGIDADTFRLFGDWIVRGGAGDQAGKGGLSWVTQRQPTLQWLLSKGELLSSLCEAMEWRERERERGRAEAEAARRREEARVVERRREDERRPATPLELRRIREQSDYWPRGRGPEGTRGDGGGAHGPQ